MGLALGCCRQATAHVLNYRGKITLHPSTAELAEALTIRFAAPAQGADHFDLYLNRDLAISSLSCRSCLGHEEGPLNMYTQARPVIIKFRRPLRPGETADIHLEAHGKLTDVSRGSNSFSAPWVELSIDSGWYPYELEARNFGFKLQVKIDPGYQFAGNGKVSGGNGTWRLVRKDATSDIDLVAAPAWTATALREQGLRIRMIAVNVPPVTIQRFAQQASSSARTYAEWFGQAAGRDITVVLSPRQGGSSYSRPGYVSLAYSPEPAEEDRLLFILAHELAHFWWSGAPNSTWENWLNEAFAEYSALMYVRKSQGQAAFRELMLERVQRARTQPPIWGVRRNMRAYNRVIYAKGAIRLLQLEQMVGQEKFRQLLATLVRKHINTTQDFLDELQAESSPQTRMRFERLLKDQSLPRTRRARVSGSQPRHAPRSPGGAR
jgi:hypothetical protein